jgi:hypothetical protein
VPGVGSLKPGSWVTASMPPSSNVARTKWIVKLHDDADACEYTVNRCCGLKCVYDHFATKLIIS